MMGGRKKTVTVWILVAAVLVVTVIGYVLVRGRNTDNSPSATAAHQVGQAIEAGGIEFTVVRSYDSKGTDSERPTLRNTFTIARVSLTNKTAQPVPVKPADFTLLVNGQEIQQKALGYVFDSLIEASLQPGAKIEGAISWEIPLRYSNKYLVYHGPEGESITVDLQKTAE